MAYTPTPYTPFASQTQGSTGQLDAAFIAAFSEAFAWAGIAGGSANALTLTLPGFQITDYAVGMVIRFIAQFNNTGAVTVAVNGLPAQNVTDVDGTPLTANAIVAGRLHQIVYVQPATGSPYFRLFSGGGGGGAVSSVFGRTGAVVAQANDYSIQQIANIVVSSTQPTGLPAGSIWLQP